MTRFNLNRFTGLLPLILLLIALSTVFLFGNVRGHFYRSGHHNAVSSYHLAVAANISHKHNFLGLYRQTLAANGTRSYEPYNRFPIGGHALIKLAISPFDGNLSAQIYAARILMLLFFAAIGVLAYLSLCRLTSNRWIALTATLLSLSSYYCLYYNDQVTNETCPGLFGVLLVFHGMVIFVQKGRFRQLLVKTCLALLLDWHVFGLLLPFIVLGLANEFIKDARSARLSYPIVLCLSLLRSRYLVLGIFALFFGMAVLSFNFANEYFALKGDERQLRLIDLRSYQSFLYRTGQNEHFNAQYAEFLAWLPFLKSQFYRIGVASLPHFYIGLEELPGIIFGIFVFSACLIGLMFVRHKILLATLALFGLCWSLPMRHHTAFHNFEGLFYIGIPLVFYSIVFYYIHRLSRNRLIAYLSVTSLLIFVLGNFYMSRVGDGAEAAEFHKATMADFDAIRKMTKGKTVLIMFNYEHGTWQQAPYCFYLAGSIVLFENEKYKLGLADFVITRGREEKTGLLTPENRLVFLYDNTNLIDEYRSEYRSVTSNEPVARSNFDIYMRKRTLYYVKPRCVSPYLRERFFLHIVPVNENDLPQDRKQYGFDIRRATFREEGRIFDGKCMVPFALPQYKIASIRAGSTIRNTDRVWAEFSLGE